MWNEQLPVRVWKGSRITWSLDPRWRLLYKVDWSLPISFFYIFVLSSLFFSLELDWLCRIVMCPLVGGGDIWNFFKAGTILQVEISVVIYEITGCKKIFWNFCHFNPPPAKLLFDLPHWNAKFQSCSTIGLWGVFPELLRADDQKSPFFPILCKPSRTKVSKTTSKATIFKIMHF